MAEPAQIQQPANQLSPVLDFSKWLAGQKTTEQGTQNQVTQGQTMPLELLIAQMSDPTNLSNLVASLFNAGASQVPVLTSQFANATGSRVTNNSMLSQSLAQLNTTLAQQIAQAAVQQQQAAATAAGKLGETNKTSSASKSGSSTTKPASTGKSLATTAGGLALGTGINKFGDILLKKAGLGSKSSTSNTTAKGSESNPPLVTQQSDAAPVDFNSPSTVIADTSTGFDDPSIMLADSTPSDIPVDGGGGEDIALDSGADTIPVDEGFFESLDLSDFDFGDFGMANGGKVPGVILVHTGMPPELPQRTISNRPPFNYRNGGRVRAGYANGGMIRRDAYADGGTVAPLPRRNVPNMGTAGVSPGGVPAINLAMLPLLDGMVPNASSRAVKPGTGVGEVVSGEGGGDSSPAGPATNTDAPPPGFGMALSLGAQLAGLSVPGLGLGIAALMALARNQAQNASQAVDTSLGEAVALSRERDGPEIGFEEDIANEENNEAIDEGFAEGEGWSADDGYSDSSDDGSGASSGSDDGGDDGSGASGGGDDGGDDGDGGSGGGDGGDGGGGGGEADGGLIKATSRKALSGVDKQPIMATPGEYMLPIDVVNYIGKDVLDDLVNLVHVPVVTR